MNLSLSQQKFIVTGASSGFGFAISKALVNENANVIMNARNEAKLSEVGQKLGKNVEIISGNVTEDQTIAKITSEFKKGKIHGLVVNAGGPPASSFEDSTLPMWDEAYLSVLRWKVDLMLRTIPLFKKQGYGRIVFIESASVKQPIQNLVLSNSLRMGVVGFVKTLSQEIAGSGVNMNIVAPGFHKTAAVDRIIKKKSEKENISYEEAEKTIKESIPLKRTGNPDDLAKLTLWLLSPSAAFVSGQVYYIDGASLISTL